jgi:hypothetical protein
MVINLLANEKYRIRAWLTAGLAVRLIRDARVGGTHTAEIA